MTDNNILNTYREKLSCIDSEFIRLLGSRMEISLKIAELKFNNKINIEQNDFWNESSDKRGKIAESLELDKDFIKEVFELIQKESIRNQEVKFKELDNDAK